MRSALILSNVKVPQALLPAASKLAADDEGLVLCDVTVADGNITAIESAGVSTGGGRVDAGGAVMMACFTDAHTHMTKTNTHPRARNPTGSINDALATELEDQPRWAACPCCRPIAFNGGGAKSASADGDRATAPCPRADDIYRRWDFGIACAYHHGTKALRSHLDGTNSPDTKLRATVYAAFSSLRAKWAAKGVSLQGVANLYLPLWRDEALAQAHVAEAVQHAGVLLGAYCGNIAGTPEPDTAAALDALFGYATQHRLQVDLHIDETNDVNCCCLLPLTHALRRARGKGYREAVVLGHCTSLALQPPATQRAVITALSELQPVSVVCNPSTNLGLQDRRGSMPPHCALVEAGTPRTPKWRGLTLIQELAAAGVPVGAATDNVRDWWHPYGDYDGLETYKHVITLGQLDTVPSEGAWAHLVSDAPAAAIGQPASAAAGSTAAGVPASVAPGARADLVLFPDARKLSELLARPQVDRIVLRAGRVQESTLPSYKALDDLVATPTKLPMLCATVQRGATAFAA